MIGSIDLQKLANKNGIDKFTVLREYVQILFLNSLYLYPEAKGLVFKGGTALRFFANSPRFSEDLDFTSSLSEKEIDILCQKVTKDIKKDVEDIQIKDLETIAGISKKIYVNTDISPQPQTIKLDFSERENVMNTKIGIIKTTLPILGTTPIIYLDPKEIFAEKIRAIMTRHKGRDLFDLWFLIHNSQTLLDIKLIQKKLDFYKERFDLKKLKKTISEWNEKDLHEDLNKFLPLPNRTIIGQIKNLILAEL
ncbi:MAG: nucleotidyl transferase AbiEii/AbiGii toxin family protein [Patescibacteria group bacterium]